MGNSAGGDEHVAKVLHVREVPIRDGHAECGMLEPGHYQLVRDGVVHYQLRIIRGDVSDLLVAGDHGIAPLNPIDGIPVHKPVVEGGDLVIRGLADSDTVIHVFASRYLEADNYQVPGLPSRVAPFISDARSYDVFYSRAMALGSELQYISERSGHEKYYGSMLPRPGMLMNPWQVGESEWIPYGMRAADFNAIGAGGGASGAFGRRSSSKHGGSVYRGYRTYDFLAQGPRAFVNLRMNAEGEIRIHEQNSGIQQMCTLLL